MSFKASLQNFTLNSVFRKLWFCVFAATYVWIKSEVLNTGLWNLCHLFFLILSIFVCMKSTLAKKILIILAGDCFSFLKTINENYLTCIPQNSVHCFNCSFVSGVKWWTHVSSMLMNRCKKSALLLWKILTTLFLVHYDKRGTHLELRFLMLKLSVHMQCSYIP